jgi:hypothetical protein
MNRIIDAAHLACRTSDRKSSLDQLLHRRRNHRWFVGMLEARFDLAALIYAAATISPCRKREKRFVIMACPPPAQFAAASRFLTGTRTVF